MGKPLALQAGGPEFDPQALISPVLGRWRWDVWSSLISQSSLNDELQATEGSCLKE